MSTENLFKPSKRKDCRDVVLANILESVRIPLDRSETHSHRVCNPCGRKICNLGNLYALIQKETKKTGRKSIKGSQKDASKKQRSRQKIILQVYGPRSKQ